MKEDEVEHAAPAADPDVDFEGKPLPDWTKRYPAEHRSTLAVWGVPTDSYPRAHEANVRLVEVSAVYDRGQSGLRVGRKLAGEVFSATVVRTIYDVGGRPDEPLTMAEALTRLEKGEPPPVPARPPEEFEVRSDWLDMYPPEYRPLLAQWGVPTIAGTQVDDFNRRLIELVPPDCTEKELLTRSAGSALLRAFGVNWFGDDDAYDDYQRYLDEHELRDLPDVCWATYPEEHRPLLQWLGRPDYEHPAAAAFNRALIAAARALRAEGLGDEAIERLRGHLWSEFFGETPCPERGDRDAPAAKGEAA